MWEREATTRASTASRVGGDDADNDDACADHDHELADGLHGVENATGEYRWVPLMGSVGPLWLTRVPELPRLDTVPEPQAQVIAQMAQSVTGSIAATM